jgi:hypothetical protein
MFVRVLKPFYTGQDLHTLGRVLSVRDDIAATWVTQGLCEYMKRTKKIETATKQPTEKAVTRSRKKRA